MRNRLFQAFAAAADGVLVVDQEQQIVFWNAAAERILGYAFDEVVEQPCHEVLRGRDEKGELVCHRYCRGAVTALRGGAVGDFDTLVRTRSDNLRWVNVSTFTLPAREDEAGPLLVHLFRDATQKKKRQQFAERVLKATQRLQNGDVPQTLPHRGVDDRMAELTDREQEVLILLARGLPTRGIAEALSISPATVRNHVRNLLQKLQAHSRVEAVVLAFKSGLVNDE